MLLDVKSVARRYGVQPGIVLTWIKRGELVAFNVARKAGGKPRWRISEEALALFETSRQAGPAIGSTARVRCRTQVRQYF